LSTPSPLKSNRRKRVNFLFFLFKFQLNTKQVFLQINRLFTSVSSVTPTMLTSKLGRGQTPEHVLKICPFHIQPTSRYGLPYLKTKLWADTDSLKPNQLMIQHGMIQLQAQFKW
jgi:hypothetical protein